MKWATGSLENAQAMKHPVLGLGFLFGEAFPREKFQDFGINVRVVEPGQPTALYRGRAYRPYYRYAAYRAGLRTYLCSD